MDTERKAGDALRTFCQEFGVPETLRHDGAKVMCGRKTEFQKQVAKYGIHTHVAEAEMHNQSPSEGVIREVKRKWFRTAFKKKVPPRLLGLWYEMGMRDHVTNPS